MIIIFECKQLKKESKKKIIKGAIIKNKIKGAISEILLEIIKENIFNFPHYKCNSNTTLILLCCKIFII